MCFSSAWTPLFMCAGCGVSPQLTALPDWPSSSATRGGLLPFRRAAASSHGSPSSDMAHHAPASGLVPCTPHEDEEDLDGHALSCMFVVAGARLCGRGAELGDVEHALRVTTPAAYSYILESLLLGFIRRTETVGHQYRLEVGKVPLGALPRCGAPASAITSTCTPHLTVRWHMHAVLSDLSLLIRLRSLRKSSNDEVDGVASGGSQRTRS